MFFRMLAAVVAGDAVGRAMNEQQQRRTMEEIVRREVEARLAAERAAAQTTLVKPERPVG